MSLVAEEAGWSVEAFDSELKGPASAITSRSESICPMITMPGMVGHVEALVGEQVTIPWDGGMTVAYPPRAAERRPRPAAAAGIATSSSSSTWPVSTSVMIRRATASNSATTGLVSE